MAPKTVRLTEDDQITHGELPETRGINGRKRDKEVEERKNLLEEIIAVHVSRKAVRVWCRRPDKIGRG
jgi:hypothetical protein